MATPPWVSTPQSPLSSPPKFRRKMRVRYMDPDPHGKPGYYHGRTGSVINPSAYEYSPSSRTPGQRLVSVRLDTQMEYERGMQLDEDKLKVITDDETQFHLRRYELRHVSHNDVEDLNVIIKDSNLTSERKVELLSLLPQLRYK